MKMICRAAISWQPYIVPIIPYEKNIVYSCSNVVESL
jgi:hypothetical protein